MFYFIVTQITVSLLTGVTYQEEIEAQGEECYFR